MSLNRKPWNLTFWDSGEWQVVEELLQDMEDAGVQYNPSKDLIAKPLRDVSEEKVRVAIIGQDPYPQAGYATGTAFSIPRTYAAGKFPPTLRAILTEYTSDLGYPVPSHGDLSRWPAQGVLLWNAIPTCRTGLSLSHDWHGNEWGNLTREIVKRLSDRGIVFALLGAVARRFLNDIDLRNNRVIVTSHPSPRGSLNSKTPFVGSRLFSTINAKLNEIGLETVDWRLEDGDQGKPIGNKDAGRPAGNGVGKVLDNITGASCGPLRDARGVEIRK